MAGSEPPTPSQPLDYESAGDGRGMLVGKCPACGGDLEQGVMADHQHLNQPGELVWFAGDWRRNWWTDFNLPKDARQYAVKAARCVGCARLELYALEPVK